MELLFRRRAALEIQKAFAHYEIERPGLGLEFFSCVEAACAWIQREPLARPPYYRSARRQYLRRFPFSIYYIVDDDLISIVAVYHGKRDPSALLTRLEEEGA